MSCEADQTSMPPVEPALEAASLVSGSLRDGWEAFKREAGILIAFVLLMIPIDALGLALTSGLSQGPSEGLQNFQHFTWLSVFGLVHGIFTIGILYASLRALRRQPVPFSTFFAGFNRFGALILGLILMQLIVGFGTMFFIIPGIFFALAFAQWPLLVMDRRAGGPDSLGKSWHMMRGYKADFLLLWLALIGINILGFLAFIAGLLVTIPLSYAAQAAFYNRLMRIHPPEDPIVTD